MEYENVKNELFQFVCDNKEFNLTQKQKTMEHLLIGIYKKEIIKYIESGYDINTIKEKFSYEIVKNIKKEQIVYEVANNIKNKQLSNKIQNIIKK